MGAIKIGSNNFLVGGAAGAHTHVWNDITNAYQISDGRHYTYTATTSSHKIYEDFTKLGPAGYIGELSWINNAPAGSSFLNITPAISSRCFGIISMGNPNLANIASYIYLPLASQFTSADGSPFTKQQYKSRFALSFQSLTGCDYRFGGRVNSQSRALGNHASLIRLYNTNTTTISSLSVMTGVFTGTYTDANVTTSSTGYNGWKHLTTVPQLSTGVVGTGIGKRYLFEILSTLYAGLSDDGSGIYTYGLNIWEGNLNGDLTLIYTGTYKGGAQFLSNGLSPFISTRTLSAGPDTQSSAANSCIVDIDMVSWQQPIAYLTGPRFPSSLDF